MILKISIQYECTLLQVRRAMYASSTSARKVGSELPPRLLVGVTYIATLVLNSIEPVAQLPFNH